MHFGILEFATKYEWQWANFQIEKMLMDLKGKIVYFKKMIVSAWIIILHGVKKTFSTQVHDKEKPKLNILFSFFVSW